VTESERLRRFDGLGSAVYGPWPSLPISDRRSMTPVESWMSGMYRRPAVLPTTRGACG
jgi:hypothetical protein